MPTGTVLENISRTLPTESNGTEKENLFESDVPDDVSGEPMCVQESRVYRGPNPYGYRPVVRLKLALGKLEKYPTDRLGALLPGCSNSCRRCISMVVVMAILVAL